MASRVGIKKQSSRRKRPDSRRPSEKFRPQDVQYAFEAYQRDKKTATLRPIVGALGSPNNDLRYAAMYALSAVGQPASGLLTTALQRNASVRPALHVLHDIADPKSRPAIENLLRHPDYSVRQLAFRTIQAIDHKRPPDEFWKREIHTVGGSIPSLTMIIHGTWAQQETWWRYPSDLPQYVDSLTHDFYQGDEPFKWSGDNTMEARKSGAQQLIAWLRTHPAKCVTLIAHSHGGNVVFKASQLDEAANMHINHLMLLGTPIRDDYEPNLRCIDRITNVYSEHDSVQLLGTWGPGMENHARNGGRKLPESSNVLNRLVTTTTDSPHSELHTVQLWKRENLDPQARRIEVT
jgi:hypothetical protein